jgi:hypothetical protein
VHEQGVPSLDGDAGGLRGPDLIILAPTASVALVVERIASRWLLFPRRRSVGRRMAGDGNASERCCLQQEPPTI